MIGIFLIQKLKHFFWWPESFKNVGKPYICTKILQNHFEILYENGW